MTPCAVAICDREAKAKGWCQTHYMRWWVGGDVRADEPIALKGIPVADRILARIEQTPDGCWLWLGATTRGYGVIRIDGAMEYVHRVAYAAMVGPIPTGLALDHLCHTRDKSCQGGPNCPHRRCANPAHLEPVTNLENSKRGRAGDAVRRRVAEITHCPRGHEYTPENLRFYKGVGRTCRECNRLRAAANRAKHRGTLPS